jgi:hypothetical protein
MSTILTEKRKQMIGKDCVDLIYKYLHNMQMKNVIDELNSKKKTCTECGEKKLQTSWFRCHCCNRSIICDQCFIDILSPNGYVQCIHCELIDHETENHCSYTMDEIVNIEESEDNTYDEYNVSFGQNYY